MSAKARHYRERLYHSRSHPGVGDRSDFVDKRDSFLTVYASAIPFLALEYIAERSYEFLPSGLVCPVGYLMFWAFYYTYYRPGFLEDRLTSAAPRTLLNPSAIIGVILGVAIWFVKVTVVELSHLFLLQWIFAKKDSRAKPQGARRGMNQNTGSWNTNTGSFNSQGQARRPTGNTYYGQRPGGAPPPPRPPPRATPPPRPPSHLPPEVRRELEVLGLGETTDWTEIHKRYRELAKKYHPDLNREITEVGKRFIRIDTAYRKLVQMKSRYFHEKRV